MATNPVTKDVVPAVNPLELVLGMGIKPITEKAFSGVVGNGNFMSGGAKMIAAIMAQKYLKGTIGNALAIGMGADGAEDIVVALTNGKIAGASQSDGIFDF